MHPTRSSIPWPELIYAATRAPSGHNTQPWQFHVGDDDTIDIIPDLSRRLRVVDPDDHALYVSLGCALENLCIAAEQRGLRAQVDCDSNRAGIRVRLTRVSRAADWRHLEAAIYQRQTTRRPFAQKAIPQTDLRELLSTTSRSGVRVVMVTSDQTRKAVASIVEEGTRAQFSDGEFVDELLSWIGFSSAEARAHGDGLASAAMGLPSVPRWLGSRLTRWFATPSSQASQQARLVRSSPALAVFLAERDDAAHWVEAGRSFERFALEATARGIRHAHVNMPCEVMELRKPLCEAIGGDGYTPILLVRLGYAEAMPRSRRRPLQAVAV